MNWVLQNMGNKYENCFIMQVKRWITNVAGIRFTWKYMYACVYVHMRIYTETWDDFKMFYLTMKTKYAEVFVYIVRKKNYIRSKGYIKVEWCSVVKHTEDTRVCAICSDLRLKEMSS